MFGKCRGITSVTQYHKYCVSSFLSTNLYLIFMQESLACSIFKLFISRPEPPDLTFYTLLTIKIFCSKYDHSFTEGFCPVIKITFWLWYKNSSKTTFFPGDSAKPPPHPPGATKRMGRRWRPRQQGSAHLQPCFNCTSCTLITFSYLISWRFRVGKKSYIPNIKLETQHFNSWKLLTLKETLYINLFQKKARDQILGRGESGSMTEFLGGETLSVYGRISSPVVEYLCGTG